MTLNDIYREAGAALAPDGIPLHFGDVAGEYQAAFNGAILLDRSHEGRIELSGADRFDLLNRMSTNNLLNMKVGEGRPTIFTNVNARILDRVLVYYHRPERLLIVTGAGRNAAVGRYIQSNVFYGDDVQVHNIHGATAQFEIHGAAADDLASKFIDATPSVGSDALYSTTVNGFKADFIRVGKALYGAAWRVIVGQGNAPAMWSALREAGAVPSGGIVYNAHRIRAGLPAVGFELTERYILLELGLWDEVSFSKGCYTGQEIIARMESRGKLAKMLVRLRAEHALTGDTPLFNAGKRAGEVTSAVIAPDGERYAMGVVKASLVNDAATLHTEDAPSAPIQIDGILGVQPLHG